MATHAVEGLSPAKQALLQQRLNARSRAVHPPGPRRAPRVDRAPLSPAQQQLWYFSRLAPDKAVYNEAVSIRKEGPLDEHALRAALREIVRRHKIWRSTFHEVDGEPLQVVGPEPKLDLPLADLSTVPAAEREQAAARLVAEEARAPYDLEHGPLLRPLLIRFSETQHRLYLCMHHLIFDGVSLYRIVLPELVALYDDFAAGRDASLPEPGMQYADYGAQLREQGDVPDHRERIEYWRRHLDGAPVLQLPLDHARPARPRFRGAVERLRIPADLADGLRSVARSSGVTLFQVLAAAFSLLLHEYSQQEEVVFGTLADLRDRHELEQMVGYCLTPLVLRAGLPQDGSFVDLLSGIRDELVDGLSNLVPFERLVRDLQPRRDSGMNPLFQVALVLEPTAPEVDGDWSLHQMEAEVSNAVGSAKFDLLLELDERSQGHIDGRLIFDTDLFEDETAVRLAEHWIATLKNVVAAPNAPVSSFSVLSAEERYRQLVEWNATSAPYPRDACLHELVAEQARRTPAAVAVTRGDEKLSYRDLDERADALARRLAVANPERGLVAIYLDRSLDMVIGMLAILKSGAAYLPLDLAHPAQRLSLMLQDSGAVALLTHSELLFQLTDHPVDVVCIDDPSMEGGAWDVSLPRASAEDLAYVIYTSGSTGRPKGVCISHRSIVNLLTSMSRAPGMTREDTILAITTYGFDIAAAELWLPLLTGAHVIIAPRDVASDGRRLVALLERSSVTVMQATPSTWQMMLDAGWSGQPGLVALSGGEPLSPQLAESLLGMTGCLWNMYGPTETTVWSTGERVERGQPVTIGRPIANTQAHILGRGGQPLPVGVAGELAIAGDGVAAGYLNRPELTRERFVPDPFTAGGRMYLTGDLARFRPDGRIEHLGRLDHQIKIRGFRVEPGEIEAALMSAPDVAAALVVARQDEAADLRLVAYVVPAGTPPRSADLRRRLRASLPLYMVPSVFVSVESLPVSPNGKLNRNALPAPAASFGGDESGGVRPRNAAEERMASIWARVLGLDTVGVHDDFFELGGHSLLALRLLSEVEQQFGVEVPVSAVFERPSFDVAGLLARIVSDSRPLRSDRGIDAHRSEAAGPKLFFVNPHEEAMLALRHFAGPDYRLIGLVPEPVEGRFGSAHTTIEELARPMLETLRGVQPRGPYFVAGFSLGGLLAYEIARQLRAAGDEVAWLGVIDAQTPASLRHELPTLRRSLARQLRRGPRSGRARLAALVRYQALARGMRPGEAETDPTEGQHVIHVARLLLLRQELTWRQLLAPRWMRGPRWVLTNLARLVGYQTWLWRPELAELDVSEWGGIDFVRVFTRYARAPHDTPLDLFVTETTAALAGSETLGWDEFHAGELRVHRVRGDHDSLMSQGRVEVVAELLRAAVKEASRAREVS